MPALGNESLVHTEALETAPPSGKGFKKHETQFKSLASGIPITACSR